MKTGQNTVETPMPITHDDPDKYGSPADPFEDFEAGELPPQVTAPPNMAVPLLQLIPPMKTPPSTPENNWCLRGPCRHYLAFKTLANVDNSAAGYLPEQMNYFCRAIPGVSMEMGGELVFECSDWEPKLENPSVNTQRAKYMKLHKSCSDADAARKSDRETAFARMQAEADERRAAETAAFELAKKNVQETIDAEIWAGTASPEKSE